MSSGYLACSSVETLSAPQAQRLSPLASYPPGYHSSTNSIVKPTDASRPSTRTPSPTPSEARELNTPAIDWQTIRNWRFWIRKEWRWYYVILFVILVVVALVSIYHDQIVQWLAPVTRWLYGLSWGWVVPIAVLFVISFPPLFGHEIVAILCGLVWGLWAGFGIVCAGTFLGEIGNFYAFRFCCKSRGEKMERTKLTYACLAHIVREGGFKIALIARLSAIPGHFTTAIFSTCGMNIFVFCLAAFLSLPKQFITVYIGVILKESDDGTTSSKSRLISDSLLGVTFVITFVAMWYIYREMNRVKPQVIYLRRKARQAKLAESASYVSLPMDNNSSESDIPLYPSQPEQVQYGGNDLRGSQYGYHTAFSAYSGNHRGAAPAPGGSGTPDDYGLQQHPYGRQPHPYAQQLDASQDSFAQQPYSRQLSPYSRPPIRQPSPYSRQPSPYAAQETFAPHQALYTVQQDYSGSYARGPASSAQSTPVEMTQAQQRPVLPQISQEVLYSAAGPPQMTHDVVTPQPRPSTRPPFTDAASQQRQQSPRPARQYASSAPISPVSSPLPPQSPFADPGVFSHGSRTTQAERLHEEDRTSSPPPPSYQSVVP